MRQLVLSLLAFTALTGAVRAADLAAAPVAPAPPPPIETFNWTGVYGGAQLGGAFGQTSIKAPALSLYSTIDNGGVLGGGYGGYLFQQQNFVFGAEGEFNVVSNKQSSSPVVNTNFYNVSVYSNYLISIDGRLGYAYKNILIYAVGGYAFINNGTTINKNGAGFYGSTQTFNGYDIGGGVEYAITPNWSARLEYRYYDFAKVTNQANNQIPSYKLVSVDETPWASTVRIGATYRWFPVAPPPPVVAVKY
jgi:outer membrane immunogenic protein